MPAYKRFNPKLHKICDLKAKQAVARWLLSLSYYEFKTPLEEQRERYKEYDFAVYNTVRKKEQTFEVERRMRWRVWDDWMCRELLWRDDKGVQRRKEVPFLTVHVPLRKNESKADYYVAGNARLNVLCICPVSVIHASSLIFINTQNELGEITKEEGMYDVPVSRWLWYRRIGAANWELFNSARVPRILPDWVRHLGVRIDNDWINTEETIVF